MQNDLATYMEILPNLDRDKSAVRLPSCSGKKLSPIKKKTSICLTKLIVRNVVKLTPDISSKIKEWEILTESPVIFPPLLYILRCKVKTT